MGILDWGLVSTQLMLTGSGVKLRLPKLGDYQKWHDLRDESRSFLTPWEPRWTDDELSHRAFRLRVQRYRQEARARTGFTFFVFDEADTTLFGGLTLGRVQRGVSQSATLGYWMGAPYAGRGIMARAVDLVASFAFDVEGLHRIEAACLPKNARSIGLLEKSGFRREGHLRHYLKIAGVWEDHVLYSLLAEDWAERPRPRLAVFS